MGVFTSRLLTGGGGESKQTRGHALLVMLTQRSGSLLLLVAALFLSACGHLDTTPEPRGDRTLVGTVNFRTDKELPADAKALVRLIDVSSPSEGPKVLSEQVISPVTSSPIAFSLDYKAEDLVPPKSARIDARISYGGKLHFYMSSAYSVTTARASRPIDLWVEPTGK